MRKVLEYWRLKLCDTDMEEESSVVSDTIVKQKTFRKRINLNKCTVSTEHEENGVDGRRNDLYDKFQTKKKSKYSRYDSSISLNSFSKTNSSTSDDKKVSSYKSNESIELGASVSGILKPDKFDEDSISFEDSNVQQNEPSLKSFENNNSINKDKSFTEDAFDRGVSEDRLRQDSDIMEEEELEP